MPSPVTRAVTVVAFAATLAACSGGGKDSAAPAATVSTTARPSTAATATAGTPTTGAAPSARSTAGDRAAVEKTFADYNAALLARNFTAACALTSPDATEALVKALNAQGAQVTTCEQAFSAVYSVQQVSGPLDDAARSAKIDDVTIAGDTATVTYHGTANGRTSNGLTNKMQRIDGTWRLRGYDA